MFIMPVPRWIARTLLIGAALAGLALGQNHTDYPCGTHQVGAAGMCVTTQYGGAA
ncbi:hypothetical protein [Micromonospora sp. NBRC 101691]|uniref:hypothetical protein n=1 Tax=Micromonospora sp. NBRC 101691 TaxID=3032198 RepID=UPI0024A3FEED|nr:hypothetical protein [Micromonospora sp. NBRC 101691]GLY21714.1 hypothetical protein Misp04_14460 [Micromonospora sp. NBRC 101691]